MMIMIQASLAAVIITAVVSSVEYEVVKPIWRSKSELFEYILTFEHIWRYLNIWRYLIYMIVVKQIWKSENWILKSKSWISEKWKLNIWKVEYLNAMMTGTDLIPGLACFLGCLFYELEMGIGLGVFIQVLVFWYQLHTGIRVLILWTWRLRPIIRAWMRLFFCSWPETMRLCYLVKILETASGHL